ncbi:MAG: hypothetical protein ABTQ32_15605, partial [Myxococcaceae bacterium]
MRNAVALVVMLAAGSCFQAISVDEAPCPCEPGYVCCARTQTCRSSCQSETSGGPGGGEAGGSVAGGMAAAGGVAGGQSGGGQSGGGQSGGGQ